RQLVTEEIQVVDARDPVRSPGQSFRIRSVREDDERLAEKERDDCEVVAEQPPGVQTEHESNERRARHDDGNRRLRLPVNMEMRGREDRVEVRTDAEKRNETQVEQSCEPDRDIEPKAE